MFRVVDTCECPSSAETVFTSTPLVISSEALRCRKLWIANLALRIPVRLQKRLSQLYGVFGSIGSPHQSVNNRSELTHLSPHFSRCCACSILYFRTTCKTSRGSFRLRRDFFVFDHRYKCPPFLCNYDARRMLTTQVSKSMPFHSSPQSSPRRYPP